MGMSKLQQATTIGVKGVDEVGDEPKLLDDGGEIPKTQGRGWFESQL